MYHIFGKVTFKELLESDTIISENGSKLFRRSVCVRAHMRLTSLAEPGDGTEDKILCRGEDRMSRTELAASSFSLLVS